jgi:hypothetical protein
VPRWDRFVTIVEDPEAFVAETTAMTRERIAAISDFPQSYEAIRGSDQWDELAPWEATYWKTLPHGVRLRRRMGPLSQEEAWRRAGGLKLWSEQRTELAMLLRCHDLR